MVILDFVETKKKIASLTATMLIEIKSININSKKPFKLTSGAISPVYIDCRRIISFPKVRSKLMKYAEQVFENEIGLNNFDSLAGGETAGIPFASFLAERMNLPMQYVRKKPKGFGKNSQIEGYLEERKKVLLVEDLATDGGSKFLFANAIREAGSYCNNIFVIFYYNIFKDAEIKLKEQNLNLSYLSTWWDVLNSMKISKQFDTKTIFEVESFLENPKEWSEKNGGLIEHDNL